jgi:hypothetical protein
VHTKVSKLTDTHASGSLLPTSSKAGHEELPLVEVDSNILELGQMALKLPLGFGAPTSRA